jgi:hypothetical protein
MAESNNAKTTYSAMSTKQKRKVDNRILEEEDPEEKALGKYVRSQASSNTAFLLKKNIL